MDIIPFDNFESAHYMPIFWIDFNNIK